ncbi:MAG: DUF5343 domain-containing protein [Dehalococcoidales bacterium]|nr:DUF5343 domain-containing protein [Dehalococcoidales bacterium]
MSAENSRRGTPPYISPTTFHHLIEQLQKNLPDRIDRSYLDELHSGSTSTQIMSALRYLNLADSLNKPTHHLKLLIASSGEERTKRFKDIANSAYSFILNNGSVDLQTATYAQLEELFHDHCGVDGDVRRKCIKFFTSLSQDADIPLSPHVTKKVRMARGNNTTRLPARKTSSRNAKTMEVPQQILKVPEHTELLGKLLDKFPDYEIEWTNEQKTKWLEGFIQFMQKIYPDNRK